MVRSSVPPRSCRLVADDADLVAVEIAHIGTVVVGMIVLSDARRTLVLAARLDRRGVGGVDGWARVGFQADRDAIADARRALVEGAYDPQLRPSAGAAVAQRLGILRMADQAERRGDAVVKCLRL